MINVLIKGIYLISSVSDAYLLYSYALQLNYIYLSWEAFSTSVNESKIL